jgi:hypothetical protein
MVGTFTVVNPFQPSDAMRHHTFKSVLHISQIFELERVNNFHPKKCYSFLGWKGLTLSIQENARVFLGWKGLTLSIPKMLQFF